MEFFALDRNYILRKPEADKAPGWNVGPANQCIKCGAATSKLSWLPPLQVTLKVDNRGHGDFVFGALARGFLASDRFVELYHRYGLIGLSGFEPVQVLKVSKRSQSIGPPPAYLYVVPERGPATIDFERSGLKHVVPPKCNLCLTGQIGRWDRIVVAEGTWQGEDIFELRGFPGDLIVTDRFKTLCEEHQLRNAEFMPIADCHYDFYEGVPDDELWKYSGKIEND